MDCNPSLSIMTNALDNFSHKAIMYIRKSYVKQFLKVGVGQGHLLVVTGSMGQLRGLCATCGRVELQIQQVCYFATVKLSDQTIR